MIWVCADVNKPVLNSVFVYMHWRLQSLLNKIVIGKRQIRAFGSFGVIPIFEYLSLCYNYILV